MDKLDELFYEQHRLQHDVMHYDFGAMTEQQRGDFIRDNTMYCVDEFSEMLHEVPFFKHWKRYSPDPEVNAEAWKRSKEEFVDVLHFFINVALALGMTSTELYSMYMAKNAENRFRQTNQTDYKPAADEA